jgi:predicted RND superfamily exporter protein
MKEAPEAHDRARTVEEVREIVLANGFEAELVGGLYALQGQVSRLVVGSLVTGVGQLLLSFLLIALVVSRSLRESIALVMTLTLVPALILGALGVLRVPLDLISAPAVNIALGMAIDDMIHMAELARGFRRSGASRWEAWARARSGSWRALLATGVIVSAGFAILVLSSFPPTRRFGLAVVGGAIADAVVCLVVLPYLAGSGGWRVRRRAEQPLLQNG